MVTLLLASAVLSGCTVGSAPAPTGAPPTSEPAPARAGPCSETRPPGFVPIRADGSKPFGAYFTHGYVPTDNEHADAPDCTRNLLVRVERLGVFQPTRRTLVDGGHRVYRLYRVTVRNTLPGSVWPIDEFQVTALDGSEPADRAVDPRQGVGVPPSDHLAVGRSVTWQEAFSDDRGNQTVIVTPSRAGVEGGLQTADIFSGG